MSEKLSIEIKELEKSQVEIVGEIPTDNFESYRENAIKSLGKNITVQGFRKGHVPEKMLLQKIGEESILQEMADKALKKTYPEIIEENNLDIIGRPEITITKIARGNPLGFKIKVTVMPKIVLADYEKIAEDTLQKKTSIKIDDKEIEDTILTIQKNHAQQIVMKELQDQPKDDQSEAGKGPSPEDVKKMVDDKLPEITDEFVKTLGEFKDVADFKMKVKEGMRIEKESKEHDKKRMMFIEKVIAGSKIPLPEILVEGELDRMMAQFEGDVKKAGGTIDDYVKHTKKNVEDMRKEWRTDAQKRVSAQLILNKISTDNNIRPKDEDIEREASRLNELHKDSDINRIRPYVEMMLTNEAIFRKLSGVEEAVKETSKN